MNDPIVEEVRRIRAEIAARNGNDLRRIFVPILSKWRRRSVSVRKFVRCIRGPTPMRFISTVATRRAGRWLRSWRKSLARGKRFVI